MRINTNVAALNSYNQLKNTNNNLSKSLSRLSSGKRINGAADDAAGLAISEKMGSQTRGLAQAQRNAQDGISMIQTAEGALKESHSILQRMRELSVQSANDTNTDADRAEIQKEVDQLAQELTRIGETTEFNTQKLLNGTLDDTKFQIGANEGQNMKISINDMRAGELNVSLSDDLSSVATGSIASFDGDSVAGDRSEMTVAKISDKYVGTSSQGVSDLTGNATHVLLDNNDKVVGYADYDTNTTINLLDSSTDTLTLAISESTTNSIDFGKEVAGTITSEISEVNSDSSLDIDFNTGINVANQTDADEAISILDNAIANVSSERSKLGSVQNRLDHTINNLNTAEENLTAAESRISDVDMAKEMMNMSKQQILSQAGTAMMAQANQLPQGVLQLLG